MCELSVLTQIHNTQTNNNRRLTMSAGKGGGARSVQPGGGSGPAGGGGSSPAGGGQV